MAHCCRAVPPLCCSRLTALQAKAWFCPPASARNPHFLGFISPERGDNESSEKKARKTSHYK